MRNIPAGLGSPVFDKLEVFFFCFFVLSTETPCCLNVLTKV